MTLTTCKSKSRPCARRDTLGPMRLSLRSNPDRSARTGLVYEWAPFPAQGAVGAQVQSAARRLYDKLAQLDIDSLDISEYNKWYFGELVGDLTEALQLRAYLLALAVTGATELGDLVLVDHGGGSGLLSLLAREAGIGTIIYNDIYDVSCRDAAVIGKSIGNPADHYAHGDIDDVVNFLDRAALKCDIIASYDVIEHVYDLDSFFATVARLPSRALTVVMASGANASNPRTRGRLQKFQIGVEYRDRPQVWGHKERDALKSYFGIRRDIVREQFERRGHQPGINEVDELARRTRGRIEPTIRFCVDEYLASGELPQPLEHPTNTCDPYTGNWAEHLVDPRRLTQVLAAGGMKAQVLPGYYAFKPGWPRRVVTLPLNAVITLLGGRALPVAPYYVVFAQSGPG